METMAVESDLVADKIVDKSLKDTWKAQDSLGPEYPGNPRQNPSLVPLVLAPLIRSEQEKVRSRICQNDDEDFKLDGVRFVGGTDISFVKGSDDALACLSVLEFPSLELVGSVMERIQMKEPYISGFLAFREQPPLQALLERLRSEKKLPEPDVWLVDGNGLLHPRRCGLACHFGVMAGVRTVGVGKNFLHVDGVTKDGVAAAVSRHLLSQSGAGSKREGAPPGAALAVGKEDVKGSPSDGAEAAARDASSPLCLSADAPVPSEDAAVEGEPVPSTPSDVTSDCLVVRSLIDGSPLCSALLSGKSGSKRPIYVSVGHRLSLSTATELVRRCCKHRMPEPVRAADLGSREALRREAAMAAESEEGGGESAAAGGGGAGGGEADQT